MHPISGRSTWQRSGAGGEVRCPTGGAPLERTILALPATTARAPRQRSRNISARLAAFVLGVDRALPLSELGEADLPRLVLAPGAHPSFVALPPDRLYSAIALQL